MHPRADPGLRQQVDGALLEDAGADPVLAVVAAAASSTTDSIPARSSSRRERQPGGARADDPDLGSHQPRAFEERGLALADTDAERGEAVPAAARGEARAGA